MAFIFTYMWKNSDQVVDRVRAVSKAQADFRLCQLRGRDSWTRKNIEDGSIYVAKVDKATEPPKPKAKAKRPWYASPSKYTDEQIQDMPWNK